MTTGYRVHAIPADVCKTLRAADDLGHTRTPFADDEGGAPLRCCLRKSVPGEEIVLVSYAPVQRWAEAAGVDPGAYDEVGPVFLHADECGGPESGHDYPVAMHGRPRVLRAYGHDGHILGGRIVDVGSEEAAAAVAEAVTDLFADAATAVIHVRAVQFGCFLAEVSRAGA
jgi:hypothetical protein